MKHNLAPFYSVSFVSFSFIYPDPSALLDMKKWLLKKPQGSSKGRAPDPDGVQEKFSPSRDLVDNLLYFAKLKIILERRLGNEY